MRGQSAVKFTAVLLVIALLGYVVVNGFNLIYGVNIPSAKEAITYGLDLKGGVYIVLQADKQNPTADEMNKARTVLRYRLDNKNMNDAAITVDTNSGRLVVEIPNATNPKEAVDYLEGVAHLTFEDKDKKVVADGKDIIEAKYVYGPIDNTGVPVHHVTFKFNNEGKKSFAEATTRMAVNREPLSIVLDGVEQSAPAVNTPITDGAGIIEGYATKEEAQNIANLISAGALPFGLKQIQVDYIGPTLGQKALDVSLLGGAIALGLIVLFMILYYRLPGVIASISLITYTILIIFIMSITRITLTLPGIAGIILSIGMAVDANVIIFERLKEELNNGKTLRAAIDAAFRRAFTAIFDSNMTTILAGLVLLFFGSGSIQGFAKVLVIGVVLSMLTALTLTRFLIKQFVDMDLVKNRWMYSAGFNSPKGVKGK